MLRLDRRTAEANRCGELQDSFHAAQSEKLLEQYKHRARRGVNTHGTHASRGQEDFPAAHAERSGNYSYENRKNTKLDKRAEKQIRASPAAWKFFQAQAPSYRQIITWWVMSAKKEETRAKRLAKLIQHSARGKRL